MTTSDKEALELSLLLRAVEKHYGYDFQNYARASLLRRMQKYLELQNKKYISELIPLLLHDKKEFTHFLRQLSVSVTEMFRDPDFFSVLRSQVVPLLKTYPFINIWHAGCSTGQEVYSMAILLEEEGLLDKCRIYATDLNSESLAIAKKATYPVDCVDLYEQNYKSSGGSAAFSDYYRQTGKSIKFHERLARHVTFAKHNLVTDCVFGDMNIILCRNVLIYFNRTLQSRVFQLFEDSLCSFGFLCLGKRENISFSSASERFCVVARDQKIYRKK